jgi:hypothetical protein
MAISWVHDIGMDWFLILWWEEDVALQLPCGNNISNQPFRSRNLGKGNLLTDVIGDRSPRRVYISDLFFVVPGGPLKTAGGVVADVGARGAAAALG